ncbi:flavodoxin reductase [Candidatus Pacearchaeota archaeon]|nr:flavodoxin reductase [Candidatus Pacearchaeota archaeon]
MEYNVRVISNDFIAPNIKMLRIEKPLGLQFVPGHAAMLSLESHRNVVSPFSITSHNADPYLEFIIKRYREGITEKFHALQPGDKLAITALFGAHRYTGAGVFIAAGTGINPFLAMLRELHSTNNLDNHSLIYSVKKHEDIILESELKEMLGDKCIITLTQEEKQGYHHGRIDISLLKEKIKDFNEEFYVCGSLKFTKDIKSILAEIKHKIYKAL